MGEIISKPTNSKQDLFSPGSERTSNSSNPETQNKHENNSVLNETIQRDINIPNSNEKIYEKSNKVDDIVSTHSINLPTKNQNEYIIDSPAPIRSFENIRSNSSIHSPRYRIEHISNQYAPQIEKPDHTLQTLDMPRSGKNFVENHYSYISSNYKSSENKILPNDDDNSFELELQRRLENYDKQLEISSNNEISMNNVSPFEINSSHSEINLSSKIIEENSFQEKLLQIPPLFHHSTSILFQKDIDIKNNDMKETIDAVLFIVGGETQSISWTNSIYFLPLIYKRENGKTELNVSNPSPITKLLKFDSKLFPSRDSHKHIFWNNQLVFIGGDVATLDAKGSDVYFVDLEHFTIRKHQFMNSEINEIKIYPNKSVYQRINEVSTIFPTDKHYVNTKLPQMNRRLYTLTYIGDDKVLMIGGIIIEPYRKLFTLKNEASDVPTVLRDAWIYDLKNHQWTEVAQPLEHLYGHTAVYDPKSNLIIVFGGTNYGNERLNDIFYYNPQNNTWTRVEDTQGSIPTARTEHSACFHVERNCMIIYGGWTGVGPRSDCYSYNIENKVWTRLCSEDERARTPRFGHSSDCFENSIIVYGGKNENFDIIDTFERLMPWNATDDLSFVLPGKIIKSLTELRETHLFVGKKAKNEFLEKKVNTQNESSNTNYPQNILKQDSYSISKSVSSIEQSQVAPQRNIYSHYSFDGGDISVDSSNKSFTDKDKKQNDLELLIDAIMDIPISKDEY